MSLLSELWLRIKFKVAEIGMTAMGGLLGGYSVASFTNEPMSRPRMLHEIVIRR